MSEKSFEQINQHLIFRLKDERSFIGSEFSYFKIFQHGIVYDFNKSKNKTLRTYFSFPLWMQKILWTRGLKEKNFQSHKLKENVWLEPGRVYEDKQGKRHSMYGAKLLSALGSSVTSINLSPGKGIQSDYSIDEFMSGSSSLDQNEINLLKDIYLVSKKLQKSSYYSISEKEYIKSALHVFFSTFRKYYHLLKDQGVKKFFFIAHYHNEGIIAACKILGIECIELQHGLINKKDLYYVYHNCFEDAFENGLMPDKIFLYGNYWKEVLDLGCEWKHSSVLVGGNYLAHEYEKPDMSKKENLILVAAQKGMDDKYIPYIQSLKRSLKNHPEWKLIVKLHPLEKKTDKYEALKDVQCSIAPLHSSIFHYLERCKVQISIYSTTFFDSAGYEVYNLSWLTKGIGSDYAASLVEDGIIEAIHPEEDPIERYLRRQPELINYLQVDRFYGSFNPILFNQL